MLACPPVGRWLRMDGPAGRWADAGSWADACYIVRLLWGAADGWNGAWVSAGRWLVGGSATEGACCC
ncbi:hypothetical protein ACLOJK_018711 [Asimina triloba]